MTTTRFHTGYKHMRNKNTTQESREKTKNKSQKNKSEHISKNMSHRPPTQRGSAAVLARQAKIIYVESERMMMQERKKEAIYTAE